MEFVTYEVQDRMGIITLNRPAKRNALSFEMISELYEAFGTAESNDLVKVVILRAKGAVFCAGADLAYLQKLESLSHEENLADSKHLSDLFHRIYTLKKIVIAQVHGHAVAGGCGLASVCDFVYAVPEAKLGYTEVKIGFVPAIVMVFLIRRLGEHHARQLLLSGEFVSAEEAQRMGLVNRVVPSVKLEDIVTEMAQRLISTNSGTSMETTKRMIADVQSMPLTEALEYASRMNATARSTADFKKGIASFLNKEDLSW